MPENNAGAPEQKTTTVAALQAQLLDLNSENWYSYWLHYLRTTLPFEAALLIVDEQGGGQVEAVASWPAENTYADALRDAAVQVLDKHEALIAPLDDQYCVAAWPAKQTDDLLAVVALVLPILQQSALEQTLATLEWQAGWLELRLLRNRAAKAGSELARHQVMLDGFNVVLDHPRFEAAALALANFSARQLNAERVVLAYVNNGLLKVVCQSDSNEYVERQNTMKLSVKAMQESLEQLESVSWPQREDREQVLMAHRQLSEYVGQASCLSVPMLEKEFCYGVMLYERELSKPFSMDDRLQAESLSNVVGLVLEQKRQSQLSLSKLITGALRSQFETFFMPGYLARKVIFLTFLVLLPFFALFKSEYHLAADAVIEGAEIRAVVVPFDGFLEAASVRAGDQISSGAAIAALDTRELRLQRMKLLSEQGQAKRQYEDALSRQDRTQVQVYSAQIERAKAELALVEFQVDQAAMQSPFDAIVVSGDQSQRIGASVRQGDVLFELAPNKRYRLGLYVDEFRINDIKIGQQGELLLAALPNQSFTFKIEQLTPVAEQRAGATVYRVEAQLLTDVSALRPGLEGVAKVAVDRRLLISIWTRGLRDWMTLQWWRLWG